MFVIMSTREIYALSLEVLFEEIMGFECSFFRFSNGSTGDLKPV